MHVRLHCGSQCADDNVKIYAKYYASFISTLIKYNTCSVIECIYKVTSIVIKLIYKVRSKLRNQNCNTKVKDKPQTYHTHF